MGGKKVSKKFFKKFREGLTFKSSNFIEYSIMHIDYGSESFKKDFNMRTGSERVFSRLLSVCMQNTPVIGLKSTANHVTIAHITVLLVGLTAAKSGMSDKVRFIKSFLPNFKP